jgi:hypothetical protein
MWTDSMLLDYSKYYDSLYAAVRTAENEESTEIINGKHLSFCYSCLGRRQNSQTPVSSVVIEKLIVPQLVKK